jgi:outer membrane protein OmpA-like peptidoglycan-associated protein
MFNLDGKDADQALFDSIFNAASERWVARSYITAPAAPASAKDDSFLRKIYQRKPVKRIADEFAAAPPSARLQPAIEVTRVTVNFAPGQAGLSQAARRALDDRVGLLPKVFSGAYIRVEGNTDDTGSAELNRALSLRRAQQVIDYLVTRHGLSERQFIPIGNGPDKPVAPNTTAAGKAKNRRTDFSVVAR